MEKQIQNPNYSKIPEKVKMENSTKIETLQQEISTTNKTIESYRRFL